MKSVKKAAMHKYILLLGILLVGHLANAKENGVEKSKTYEDSFSVDPNINFELEIDDADVVITTTDSPTISYKFTITVRAESEEAAVEFIDHVVPNVDVSPNVVSMDMQLCMSKMHVTNNRKKIKFQDGPWIKFHDYQMKLEVSIPKTARVDFCSSYSNITMGDLSSKLKLKLYDSSIRAGNVAGISDLSLSYGDAYFKTLAEVEKLKLYEVKFEAAGISKDAKIKSSYSNITVGELKNTELHSYEDKLYFTNVGDVRGQLTYSHLKADKIEKWATKTYECEITVGSAGNISGTSHYSTFEIDQCDDVFYENTYEDRFRIGELKSFKGEGHYGKFDFGKVSSVIDYNGYEDNFEIAQVGAKITKIDIEGQYVKVDVVIPQSLVYSLDLDLQYPNVEYPQEDFTSTFKPDDSSSVKATLSHKNGGGASFRFKMYEGKVSIRKASI